jgi:hypothetical protein
MKYNPIVTMTKRDAKIAVWVNMPSGDKYNIWDLEDKECSVTVINAIASAFERGMLAQKQMINQAMQTSFPSVNTKVETK